ncbi:MAG: glycosyltransferase [Anaerolineae bacterium]|nr:glycosyltransferase [Anaerolineae bacterium]
MIDPQKPNYLSTPVHPSRRRFQYQADHPPASPVVTIITPFYNTGAVFHETAVCVFNQSLQDWEWLIINDGSDDPDALAILDHYAQLADPRIRIIHQINNQGLSAARNKGALHAQSQFLFFVDGDDLIEATLLEKCLWCLLSKPALSFINSFTVHFGSKEDVSKSDFGERERFLVENCATSNFMIRKIVYQAVGGCDIDIRDGMEDWDFWLRCASKGYWGDTIPEYLFWYRRRQNHEQRWTNWGDSQKFEQFRDSLHIKYSTLVEQGMPSLATAAPTMYSEQSLWLPVDNSLKKNKKRIMLLVPWFAIGGGDKFNLDLIGQLVDRHDCDVTLVATNTYGDTWSNIWLPVFAKLSSDLFVLKHFLNPTDFPRFLHYLIRSRKIDSVVVTHSELGYRLLPYLRAQCPQVAFMDYVHMEIPNWMNGGFPRLSLMYQQQLDLTLTTSNHLTKWMTDRGGDPKKIETCYINIDADAWNPALFNRTAIRADLGIAQNATVITYVCRLVDQKRPQIFAKVMNALKNEHPNIICLVAGDGPERGFLEKYIEDNDLSFVKMLGAQSENEVKQLLACADIFFLPSDHEGIALAIYEAMAMGLAVVGADVGGQSELVTTGCGFLLPRLNNDDAEIQAYTATLSMLIKDPQRCRRVGQMAQLRIRDHFSLNAMGDFFMQAIQRACEITRTHPPARIPQDLANTWALEVIRLPVQS